VDGMIAVLFGLNVIAGFGAGLPLARALSSVRGQPDRARRYLAALIGVYFFEGLAMGMGMSIPVFSIALAFVWGALFGWWLRRCRPLRGAVKAGLWMALYTCLPAVSFLLLPLAAAMDGWNVLSTADGVRFGIPEFLMLPWPLSTILGFYAAMIIAAVAFKVVITWGEVALVLHLWPEGGAPQPAARDGLDG